MMQPTDPNPAINNLELFEQKESIKLTLNAKQDYQWKIKILSLDVNRLEELNKDMESKFGKKNGI